MTFADIFATGTALRVFIRFLPLLSGVFCAFLSNLPVSITGGALPPPLLALVPIYFWCLVRPDLMTPAAALTIGIAEDIASGGPPGVWTLAFVLTYALVARQRDSFAGLSGLVAVVGFGAAASTACASAYFTIAALYWHFPPLAPILSELAMTVLFYVPTVYVAGIIHHRLVGASRSDI